MFMDICRVLKDMDRDDWKIVGYILSISTGIVCIMIGLLIFTVYIHGGF